METLKKEISSAMSDHESGSLQLLDNLIRSFESFYKRSGNQVHTDMEKFLSSLETGFNDFPVIQHFLKNFKEFLSSGSQANGAAFLSQYNQKWENIDHNIAIVASKIIDCSGKSIMVHSNSKTIQTFLKIQKSNSSVINIIQTESRPVMEGRKQAEYLINLGFPVKFITDSSAARYFSEIEYVITGADRINSDSFINKTGTMVLALLAREFGKPFYVLFDSRKIVRDKPFPQFEEKQKDPEEVWKNHPLTIEVKNYYFESIPMKLVTHFICEKGIYKPSDTRNSTNAIT